MIKLGVNSVLFKEFSFAEAARHIALCGYDIFPIYRSEIRVRAQSRLGEERGKVEHVSYVLQIDPSRVEEYKKRHSRVDPELESLFKAVGIHRYHIFFHEGTLFAYLEVENFTEAMTQLDVHPANIKWQTFMADMLLDWENGKKIKMIPEVYRYVAD